ncbi:MAG: cation transporter [Gemmatimonas sp.]|nr:cation transporter [Gemmatimonas sp.]
MKTRLTLTQILALAVAIYAMWLVLSGHYTGLLLALGVVSTVGVVLVTIRMDLLDHEGVPLLHLTARVWTYIPWLIVEVVKSNLAATRVILDPKLPISPTIVRFRGKPHTDLGRFIFANSITLTPGTITVAVTGADFHVHALFWEAIDGIEEGEMNRRVRALEKGLPNE